MPRYFSRGEADALLPRLEQLLRVTQALLIERAEIEEHLLAARAKIMGNGHAQHEGTRELHAALQATSQQLAGRIEEIGALGVIIKDVETGLVDFPALRGGREVYLCWRLGEPRVAWWHEIEGGLAGRQALADEAP